MFQGTIEIICKWLNEGSSQLCTWTVSVHCQQLAKRRPWSRERWSGIIHDKKVILAGWSEATKEFSGADTFPSTLLKSGKGKTKTEKFPKGINRSEVPRYHVKNLSRSLVKWHSNPLLFLYSHRWQSISHNYVFLQNRTSAARLRYQMLWIMLCSLYRL